MARTIGIGKQDFEKVRINNNFYVDKTDFIRQWWETDDEVTLITRPRRFGKTLNLSMLEKFFSVEYEDRGELFEGLSIWQEKSSDGDFTYRRLQGTWPVIALSFAKVKETSYLSAKKRICQIITDLYNKFDFLLNCGKLNEKEKAFFQKVSADMEDYVAADSLNALSNFLMRYYGKKVIILLDEYDTPMQEAYINGYWKELVDFARGLFNAAFKTNPYLERALMTGITRISKESIFSDLNNLEVVTTTSKKYSDCFGFTEEEVFASLNEYGLSGQSLLVKEWYDGFSFGAKKDIYNPWSIINFLDKKEAGAYWANTSANGLIEKLLREGSPNIKQTFETLLNGGTLCMEIDEQIIYDQLSVKKNAIWSLLLASGYLKASNISLDPQTGRIFYSLKLTNKEVCLMFEKMVQDWFSGNDAYNDFIKALLLGDLKAMNTYMNRITMEMFSYFDTGSSFKGKKSSEDESERFYHGFVLGLMVELTDRYLITSNRESGFGRYDVVLEPKRTKDGSLHDAMILEFKVQDKDEKNLSDAVSDALKQIEEKEYETNLIARGIPKEHIRKYGFAFCGKRVLIGTTAPIQPGLCTCCKVREKA